ncbi:HAD family hydrolase [Polaromonas sp.]|uniref:HAD family hydrolase n=1 Tax=Polaromonas sp. TaxID=1869339 RepID=UPI003CA6ADD1
MNQAAAVVLDLDGVIVKSNLVKHHAMLSLFSAPAAELEKISAYILANGGVRRDHKITHVLGKILGIEPTGAVVADYLSRYAEKLESLLSVAPLVEGVKEFLAVGAHTFYVSSSAPEIEVEAQLARANLAGSFAKVYGAGTPKASALHQIVSFEPDRAVIFFGDSVGDLEAAKEANVAFVAVACELDNFPGQCVIKVSSFASLASVEQAIQGAIALHAI